MPGQCLWRSSWTFACRASLSLLASSTLGIAAGGTARALAPAAGTAAAVTGGAALALVPATVTAAEPLYGQLASLCYLLAMESFTLKALYPLIS